MGFKGRRFNGKPMSHWEAEAKRFVVESLVRCAANTDERSIIGEIAAKRFMELARAESPELVEQVLKERSTFIESIAQLLGGIHD